jgi:hypothetical protein
MRDLRAQLFVLHNIDVTVIVTGQRPGQGPSQVRTLESPPD